MESSMDLSFIKFHRQEAGLTQLELAELSGVGKTLIFDTEHGKDSIGLDNFLKILKVLNIQIIFKSPLLEHK